MKIRNTLSALKKFALLGAISLGLTGSAWACACGCGNVTEESACPPAACNCNKKGTTSELTGRGHPVFPCSCEDNENIDPLKEFNKWKPWPW